MSTTTQQAQDADFSIAPSQQEPPSSPIDGFGSPSLLTLPPPVGGNSRSQSAGTQPRLQLASSASMSQSRGTRSSSLLPRPSVEVADEEEVDELDEFYAQPPIDLNSDEFEKLEAESFRQATQRREQSAPVSETNNSSHTVVNPSPSQKRPLSGMIDLRDTSHEPSAQSYKRARAEKRVDDDVPPVPFFEEAWVQDLLSKSKGVRLPSPPEPIHSSRPCPPSGSQVEPIVIDDTSAPYPAPRPSSRSVASTPSIRATTSNPLHNSHSASASNSSSDDDMPLASRNASNGTCDEPAPILAAITKAENAVAELKKAYKDEADGMKIRLAERDLVIDSLKAQLRKRPSK